MREILFRAKAINRDERYETRTKYKNGDWVYGLVSRLGSEKYDIPMEMTNTDGTSGIEVDRKSIGEYIGITDKNNVRIFEGDIITCVQNSDGNLIDRFVEIGYVEMKYGAFGLHRKQGYYRPFKDWLEDYEYEVIGNIHDNIELIGGSQND